MCADRMKTDGKQGLSSKECSALVVAVCGVVLVLVAVGLAFVKLLGR